MTLISAVLTGCGVSAEDRPRVVQPPLGPFPSPGAASSTPAAGRVDEVLCFVRDDRLVRVVRRVDTGPTVDVQLQHLLAGPTQQERDDGFTSALPGAVTVTVARVTGATAGVDVREVGDDTGRSDSIFAYGQIVCTLTARDDIDAVAFLRQGQPRAVPRGDGSLTQQPLTAADYTVITTGTDRKVGQK